MKILIVDDEPLALNRVKRILEELGVDKESIFSTTDPEEAIKIGQDKIIDIAFLDINMPISGLSVANDLLFYNSNMAIIFQTAYDEYALDAFKVGAIGYLLKPILKDSLELELKKAQKFVGENRDREQVQRFLTKSFGTIKILEIKDIIYIKADLSEVIIKTATDESYMQKSISSLEEILEPYNFFRVHRSYLVNLDKVKEFDTIEQSKLVISFNDTNEYITTSKEKAKKLRDHLKGRYSF